MEVRNGSLLYGRKIEFFQHGADAAWGYGEPQEDSFAVIHPKDEKPGVRSPLYVVFHSAGHELYSCINCMRNKGDHDIYHTPEDSFALVCDCVANSKNDWWWGGSDPKGEYAPERPGTTPSPCERRVIDTVKWTTNTYAIDARRVYAVGNSMGGSGALGTALCRGDIFAAVKVNVTAGVRHAMDRCGMNGEGPEGFTIPDPPIVVDYSAQNDYWSYGHDLLYAAMRERKYAIMGFFGPFGHENNDEKMTAVNDLIHAFDIGSVHLGEAYPAFVGATTDDALPWKDCVGIEGDERSGQINAFFRWEVLADEADRFEIALRLLRPDEWESRFEFPTASVADVTMRRLQKFRLASGERFAWEYAGKSGECTADESGVPTVERLEVVREPRTLVLRRE